MTEIFRGLRRTTFRIHDFRLRAGDPNQVFTLVTRQIASRRKCNGLNVEGTFHGGILAVNSKRRGYYLERMSGMFRITSGVSKRSADQTIKDENRDYH